MRHLDYNTCSAESSGLRNPQNSGFCVDLQERNAELGIEVDDEMGGRGSGDGGQDTKEVEAIEAFINGMSDQCQV